MKSLAESIQIVARQFHKVEKVSNPDELRQTTNEFSSIMGEVVGFIQDWLEHWTRMYGFM